MNLRSVVALLLLSALGAAAQVSNLSLRDLRKAAKKGDRGAQYELGMAYADAYRVKRDYAKAVEWLALAGEQGHPQAQEFLAKLYYTGKGVTQSHETAARWLRKSAEIGNPEAQCLLGNLYLNGEGVEQSQTEAARWYRMAAEQGHAQGQYNLGAAYNNGEGVERDPVEAYRWIHLSTVNPPEELAGDFQWSRDNFRANMPKPMLVEAEQRARAWKPKSWAELSRASFNEE